MYFIYIFGDFITCSYRNSQFSHITNIQIREKYTYLKKKSFKPKLFEIFIVS